MKFREVVVTNRVDAACFKKKVRELMEQSENLPGLGRAIIDINQREHFVE
jgi:hypothetical protein